MASVVPEAGLRGAVGVGARRGVHAPGTLHHREIAACIEHVLHNPPARVPLLHHRPRKVIRILCLIANAIRIVAEISTRNSVYVSIDRRGCVLRDPADVLSLRSAIAISVIAKLYHRNFALRQSTTKLIQRNVIGFKQSNPIHEEQIVHHEKESQINAFHS